MDPYKDPVKAQQENEKAIEDFKVSFDKLGLDTKCHVCADGKLAIAGALRVEATAFPLKVGWDREAHNPGGFVAFVYLVCDKCGHTIFFSAKALNLPGG